MKKTRHGSIRQFISLWVGTMLLSFILLVGGLLYAVPSLNAKAARVWADSQSLHTDQLFELALLEKARLDLLEHSGVSTPNVLGRPHGMDDADKYLDELKQQADTSDSTLVEAIVTAYQPVRRLAVTPRYDSRNMQIALDDLLTQLHRYRDRDTQEMDATLQASSHLDQLVGQWTVTLTVLASVLLLSGSLLLWKRLFTPVLTLAQSVEDFGGGNLKARSVVERDDEMGDLCRNFNLMAEAISEREKERLHFVATVAHDLRNPLVVISGGAQLLQNKEFSLTPDEKEEWLGNIQSQTHRLEMMIGDLLDGVQAETGRLAFDMGHLDFAALVREITKEYAKMVETHPIHYSDDGPCLLDGDRKRLERVVMNLISNAVKYSPSKHKVEVKVEKTATHAILTVSDEGAGIAPEDMSRLFLPFSRLDRTKKMASGTGLGLSSVKKIIEGHAGTITVQSTLGVGTTFEVRLPLLEIDQETE